MKDIPQLLIADRQGRIYSHPALEATGMKAGNFLRLRGDELIKLPPSSRLFMLPDRHPVGFDPIAGHFTTVECDPYSRNGKVSAIAAFTPPGYTITYSAAYKEAIRCSMLPLFAYAAVVLYKGGLFTTAIKVANDKRHDARYIDMAAVKRNVKNFRKIFSNNRLVRHLESCALVYGCPNAQNFFLSRYECPLPTSPVCNAACPGCISYQPKKSCQATQPRIKFVPTPEEIAEIALFHIERVRDPIVSFGQGCEGEPLLAGDIIEHAIRLIRKNTDKGTIHMNTNASRPYILSRLFDAGLDSIRVSMNSVRPIYYTRYYRPKGYTFDNVINSIRIAKRKKRFVSLNYLVMPGFTDSCKELEALSSFITHYHIDMLQLRNLNYDPMRYFEQIKTNIGNADIIGIKAMILQLRHKFRRLMIGYFNPAKKGFRYEQ